MAQSLILVVDDEPAVRSFVTAILRRAGFQTVEAVDGLDALEQAQQLEKVDLLLTDVRMPRMDGIALARAFSQKFPRVPILFISGYPYDLDALDRPVGECARLTKPFSRPALLDAVNRCLLPVQASASG